MSKKHWVFYISLGLVIGALIGIIFSITFGPYRYVDILITNGTIIDGSGAPSRTCDVAIRDGKILGLSRWRFYFTRATTHIDAGGLIVAPGFIDVHTHVEPNIPTSGPFRADNF